MIDRLLCPDDTANMQAGFLGTEEGLVCVCRANVLRAKQREPDER